MQKWGADGFGSSAIGGSTAAVLANAKHPKEALEFITWMTTSKEGIDAMIKYCGIGWSPAVGLHRRAARAAVEVVLRPELQRGRLRAGREGAEHRLVLVAR